MVGTIVHVHVLNQATAKTILGKHNLHNFGEEGVVVGFNVLVERFFDEHFRSGHALSAGITGVAQIFAVSHLLAGENHLFSIDDDDIVAAFDVGRVARLVFTTQDLCNFRAKTAEVLVGGIDKEPLFFNALRAGGYGFVA